jgi:hypothetical protein
MIETVLDVRLLSSWRVASSPSLFPTLCSRQATASTALVADREIVGVGRTTESPWLSPSIWEDVGWRRPWLMCDGCVEMGGAHVSLE